VSEILVRPDMLAILPGVAPLITKYAAIAAEQGGLTVGGLLGQLEDYEIDDILARVERDRHDQAAFMPWMLFAIMLANGEGMPVPETYQVSHLVRKLLWLVQVEMLRREGHVELDLNQLSLETFEMSQVRPRAVPAPDGQPANDRPLGLRMQPLPLRDGSGTNGTN
jgi:hypothetical protein